MTTYRYQGNGAFVPGIPARDLDEAAVAGLSDAQRDAVQTVKGPDGKRLYVKASAPKKAAAPKQADGDAAGE